MMLPTIVPPIVRKLSQEFSLLCVLSLKLLDDAGLDGELQVREVRSGRTEVVQMWGRPESVRQEFKKIRSQ